MTETERILLRGPNWVGDAVMATPALRALRAGRPRAEIWLEAPAPFADLYRGLPDFDRFLPAVHSPGALLARARELRRERVACAVLLPDSPRAALPAALAGIPRRLGYARDRLRAALLTEALPPPQQHGRRLPIPMVERYLALTRAAGCPDADPRVRLAVDPLAAEAVAKRLAPAGLPDAADLLVVAVGSGAGSSKLWPAEHFAAACDAIARRHGLHPVLAPAPHELGRARAVADAMRSPARVLCEPCCGLAELVALIDRAALVLCGDTGPRQIAVARERPVVVVMGPTDPRHTAHQLAGQRVLREPVHCAPCHLDTCPTDHRCLRQLAPERAVAAADELLA